MKINYKKIADTEMKIGKAISKGWNIASNIKQEKAIKKIVSLKLDLLYHRNESQSEFLIDLRDFIINY